jgi:hypothetical protein
MQCGWMLHQPTAVQADPQLQDPMPTVQHMQHTVLEAVQHIHILNTAMLLTVTVNTILNLG